MPRLSFEKTQQKESLRVAFEKALARIGHSNLYGFDDIWRYSSAKASDPMSKFDTIHTFVAWWIEQYESQNGCCHYCTASFKDLNTLIDRGILGGRKTAGSGIRCRKPETERLNAKKGVNFYSPENCVLACYYCNNDKSYIYNSEHYKKYLAPAKGAYIRGLLTGEIPVPPELGINIPSEFTTKKQSVS